MNYSQTNKYKYETIIFIVDAICMVLELIASRLLSPYFGNSNIVWTSVIGIILLSSSIGNYIGGRLADKENQKKILKMILIITAVFTLIIPFFQKIILEYISTGIQNIKTGAIISTILLFFIPSMLIGAITPIIIKLKIKDIESAGESTGKITAIATIGGIFGTFLGGFILIPNIGSVCIIYIVAVTLAIISLYIDFKINDIFTIGIICMIIISLILMILNVKKNEIGGENVLQNKLNVKVSYDTQYGRVLIYNDVIKNEPVRILNIDSGFESATYTEEEKKYELVFEYTKYYDMMFKSKNEIKNTLLIGGAGYSYPKYYISHYPNKAIDVVEIDGDITKLAKKYFFLDKLIDDYNLENTKRLNLINEDGRVYLNKNIKKYDAILNDAFSGENPAKTLTTTEAIIQIKKSLNDNGLYLTNIISSLEGENSKFLRAEVNTLKQQFKNVYVIPCNNIQNKVQIQNNMVIASNQDINYEKTYDLSLNENELVITDNYCPIDTLIPQK